MVPMFECSKSYKIMSPKNHKFGDDTTVRLRIIMHILKYKCVES